MSRLLRAGFFRLRRSKIYVAAMVAVTGYCIFMYLNEYLTDMPDNITQDFVPTLDAYFFNTIIMMGVVVAIFISIFVGNEYSNGSIRNKLVVGSSRTAIYFSSMLNIVVAGTALVMCIYTINIMVGLPLMGPTERPLGEIVILSVQAIFLVIAYSSIFHMVAMLSPSKTNTAIINILLAFGLLFLAIMLYDQMMQPEYIQHLVTGDSEMVLETVKNVNYLTGTKREIYQMILNILPSGQSLQLVQQGGETAGKMILYSLGITAVTSTIGVTLFRRKDIK